MTEGQKKYNIFIEGIPGSGKSTLLETLALQYPGYHAFREGDSSPIELAWCAYMEQGQYEKACRDMADLRQVLEEKTVREGDRFIVPYTKIITENFAFYSYMEQFEIYGGRRPFMEFRDIVLRRFSAFQGEGNLFECSFFQNTIEELMLFAMKSDEEIVEFYKDVVAALGLSSFKLVHLVPSDIEDSLQVIKKERVNEQGEEAWYPMMMAYLSGSPYGKAHHLVGFEDLVLHFKRRIALEEKVMSILPQGCCFSVKSKEYDSNALVQALEGG